MTPILDVAQYLVDGYKRIFGSSIEELKLQKLLYLAQRESYAVFDEPLFPEKMQGWTYGPVSPVVRWRFGNLSLDTFASTLAPETEDLLGNVLLQYGNIDKWDLVKLTHRETSWNNSREGLLPEERGYCDLLERDIRSDALNVRPYLGLNEVSVKIRPVGEYAVPRRTLEVTRKDAKERLGIIARLQDGWRGPGTVAFPEELINQVETFLDVLPIVPLPVPSVRGGIQLEFEERTKGFLAIMLFADSLAEVYAVSPSGAYEAESMIRGDDVQAKVQAFQEGRIWRS